ncbi:uncharacterized protein LOC131218172 [Magnolia sinica]|uniref:uncharacterized protein LOC131218172 n=1 Tax=Magnolia sinica TaxID=86752 RepID=UPI0026588430|nr:uncharacterized protein LOC131218172 [Magnolia sinica]
MEEGPPGRVKLNVDSSARGNPENSGGGGICRKDDRAFVFAFATGYEVGSNNLAELRAIHDRIVICLKRGLTKVIVESDFKVVINLLMEKSSTPWRWKPWVARINALMQLGSFTFNHILREGNDPVYSMARARSGNQATTLYLHMASLPEQVRG